MKLIEEGRDYKVFEDSVNKVFKSENANYIFNEQTGVTYLWGNSFKDNPGKFPAPTILDLEITTKCTGVNGKPCKFCFPEGVLIKMADGSLKSVENIETGDKVKGYKGNYRSAWRENTAIETYTNEYEGELIILTLENGTILEVTPNHPILTNNRGWVLAGELLETDDLAYLDSNATYHTRTPIKCENCGEFVDRDKIVLEDRNGRSIKTHLRGFCSENCKQEFFEKRKKTCAYCHKEFTSQGPNDLFCKECREYIYFPGSDKHPLWNLYSSMIQRCFNPKNISYKFYGAVGKVPDDRWMSFSNFLEDMEASWFPGATLDRIDNSKGYSKENCRWVTKVEQRTNRRKFKNSKRAYKHIVQLPRGSYSVQGPNINGSSGNKTFKTLGEALAYRNERYRLKFPQTWEIYIKE